jgi:hypothetical protein
VNPARPTADGRTDGVPPDVPREIGEEERGIFFRVVSTDLSPEQLARAETPHRVYPDERHVLAVHWHPEFVPMEAIAKRIAATFPNRKEELIIPTQHNTLMRYGPYSGVEVDCYARAFNQKIQLLLHFEHDRVGDAGVLRTMLEHTFKYRASQLFEFLYAITKPVPESLDPAVRECGADDAVVRFVRAYVAKIQDLIETHFETIPRESMKNKLLRDFFDELRPACGDLLINRAQALLKSVKLAVKAHFPLKYFYRASEVIEETRALGGGVVIPHPEQFWPVLLAGYDVDGIEVWNPESRRYTEFLVHILTEKNRRRGDGARKLLIFMGDDCHMGEKVRDPALLDPAKANRQIGLQPAWHDIGLRKALIKAGMEKASVIAEYKARLAG